MDEKQQEELQRLRSSLIWLNAKALGLALGLLFGLGLFVTTNFVLLEGGHVTAQGERVVGPHLALLGRVLPGYDVSFLGSLVGLAYGFALGTLSGTGIGAVYNVLTRIRRRGEPGSS